MEVKKLSLREIGYKKLIILLLAGAALIFFSFYDFSGDDSNDSSQGTASSLTEEQTDGTAGGFSGEEYISYCEERLRSILSCIDGVDEAEVMITLEAGAESIVLKDTPYTNEQLEENDGAGGTRKSSSVSASESTVKTDGDETPYVTKELPPKVAGVLIVAKGSITGSISLQITGAVEALFGIPAHKIHIIKSKTG